MSLPAEYIVSRTYPEKGFLGGKVAQNRYVQSIMCPIWRLGLGQFERADVGCSMARGRITRSWPKMICCTRFSRSPYFFLTMNSLRLQINVVDTTVTDCFGSAVPIRLPIQSSSQSRVAITLIKFRGLHGATADIPSIPVPREYRALFDIFTVPVPCRENLDPYGSTVVFFRSTMIRLWSRQSFQTFHSYTLVFSYQATNYEYTFLKIWVDKIRRKRF